MLCSSIKKTRNDPCILDTSTATFEVQFDAPKLHRVTRSNGVYLEGTPSSNAFGLYETTKHGDSSTYTIITNKCSPLDSMPIHYLATAASESWKVTRMLAGSENIDLEYVVGKGLTEDSPFFLRADLADCGFTWKMKQCCEREHVEALKVGLFLFELEKVAEWKEVPMLEDDDMVDWVDVEKVSRHEMEVCNGLSVVESSKKGVY